jgi:hypothetical protein
MNFELGKSQRNPIIPSPTKPATVSRSPDLQLTGLMRARSKELVAATSILFAQVSASSRREAAPSRRADDGALIAYHHLGRERRFPAPMATVAKVRDRLEQD